MSRLSNPYLAIVLVPLAVFLLMIHIRVEPDMINLWGRGVVFALLGYIGSRYVGRAPVLAWERNFTPEARNIFGWALALVGFMFQIAYGWIYIAYDRPLWLASQYWGAAFLTLVGVGLAVVASSVPRLPPFGGGRNGLSEVASIFVVIASTLGLFIASHIPQLMAVVRGLWNGLLAAV